MKIGQKKDVVKQLEESFLKAQSAVLIDFTGLGSNDLNLLRDKISESGGKLQVAKNTLIERALAQIGKWPAKGRSASGGKMLNGILKGPTAIILSFSETLSPIKALVSFREELEKPEIKGGLFEGSLIDTERVLELSQIPEREELLSQLAQSLNNPLQTTMMITRNPLQRFVAAVKKIADGQIKSQETLSTSRGGVLN